MSLRKAIGYAMEQFSNELLYSIATGNAKPFLEYLSKITREFREIRTGYWKDVDRDS